jgi:NTF2-related export protein 1/2
MDDRLKIVELYPEDLSNLMEWNGHVLSTQQQIANYIQGLPVTSHKVSCVDAHPLPGNQGGDAFLITIHGDVTYASDHKREFFQRFVVRRNPAGKYFIFNDYYRWLSEP